MNIICPDCWFEFIHVETEDIIMCPTCSYEFYPEESVGDE